jgi:hypothetical protein
MEAFCYFAEQWKRKYTHRHLTTATSAGIEKMSILKKMPGKVCTVSV